MNPCEKCRQKPNCPAVCYPRRDYERHMQKQERKQHQGYYKAHYPRYEEFYGAYDERNNPGWSRDARFRV